jgi:Tfp pilus assembly protein FimT
MAINERLIHTAADAAGGGTGNQEEGLILHLDANDVDSYDGDGSVWYDITNHEYTPAVDPSEHFNTVTYSGTGATNSITGVGFQPDLVWIKNRGGVENHYLLDS